MPHSPSPNNHTTFLPMGYNADPYLHSDPAAVDFRAFYPYTPNEVKHRKRTTTAQLKVLEAIFKKDTKPNASLRTELALQLDMTPRGVQVWFQNRRAKEKTKGGKGSIMAKESGASGSGSSDGFKEDFPRSLDIKGEAVDDDESTTHIDDSDELDAFSATGSKSPTSIITSPPQLHLITDATKFPWQNSPVEPPDSATLPIRPPTNTFLSASAGNHSTDLYAHRRGSLPVTAFPPPVTSSEDPMRDTFDPLLRRSSVDASLQRLANNPFASLARAKNSALYGPGFGVVNSGNGNGLRHHQVGRLPYGYPPPHRPRHATSSNFAPVPQHGNMRRLSMDSRQSRLAAMSRIPHSPSPSPLLTPYNAVIRASLPEHRLYAVSSRTVASPIPGPLPSPGFSFGAASTPSMASPSSGESERNSPDSARSFFREEELEDDITSPYDAYSRFGSIASIATSESSINSAYYAEIGGPDPSLADERRDSCASGQGFLGLLSGLDVNNQPEHMQSSLGLANFSPHEGYVFNGSESVELVGTGDMHHRQQDHHQTQLQQHAEASYPSPTSTISPGNGRSPNPQEHSPPIAIPSVTMSTSSALAFALDDKLEQVSHQEQYLTYPGTEHLNGSEHQQDGSAYYSGHQQQQQPSQHQDGTFSSSGYAPLSEVYPQESQQQHQLDYYSPSGAFADALSGSGNVIDNGMPGVNAFAAYT